MRISVESTYLLIYKDRAFMYRLIMFKQIKLVQVWWIRLLFMAVLSAVLYTAFAFLIKSIVTEQQLKRQQLIARAQGANIAPFFQMLGESVASLAQINSVKNWNGGTTHDLDVFVERWRSSGLIAGVVLIDSKGTVQFNANVLGAPDIGASLADRGYFLWAKNQEREGDYFIGQPVKSRLGASKDTIIIPVASPVFQNDVFNGVIVAAVSLQALADRYLQEMQVSDQKSVYLLDDRGTLLFSRSSSDLSDAIREKLTPAQTGSLQIGEYLVAYSPLLMGNHTWTFVVVSSTQSVADSVMPLYQQGAFALFLFLTIASALVVLDWDRKA